MAGARISSVTYQRGLPRPKRRLRRRATPSTSAASCPMAASRMPSDAANCVQCAAGWRSPRRVSRNAAASCTAGSSKGWGLRSGRLVAPLLPNLTELPLPRVRANRPTQHQRALAWRTRAPFALRRLRRTGWLTARPLALSSPRSPGPATLRRSRCPGYFAALSLTPQLLATRQPPMRVAPKGEGDG